MTFELGVYSFGNTPPEGSTADAIRNALEAVKLADEVGLDFFGFGEHHTPSMPLSSPTAMVNAAAASTQRIKLGTTVSVLSTDEPLRIWLGTGGSPNSVGRAVELGLPMFLGILGGTPAHWGRYGHAYRQAWAEVGHPAEDAGIAVAVHGFVGPDNAAAKATYLDHELRMFATGAAEIGRPGMAPAGREAAMGPGGMVFAGGPNEVAERILDLHEKLGHDRQILQMDVGGMPHATFLQAIELLGTEVLPRVRKELGQ